MTQPAVRATLLLPAILIAAGAACGSALAGPQQAVAAQDASQSAPGAPAAPTAPAAAAPTAPATPAADAPAATRAVSYVRFMTSMGPILIELDEKNAPISAANFAEYAKSGFYDGTCFHRIIPGFVVQGGGFTTDMVQKPTRSPIKNEWKNGLKNSRGTLSMARLGGRADSATSQFFINLVDNAMLDKDRDGAAYAVFGRVVDGMDVVDAMAKVPTGNSKGHRDVPKQAVILEKAEWFETRPEMPAAKPAAAATAPATDASAPAAPAQPK